MRISNLIVAASAAGLVAALPKREMKKRDSGFKWVGTSESGAEFGSALPGTLGTDYTWPDTSKIEILRNKGMNIFRIPFLMERLTPNGITGSFASTYLSDLKSTVEYVTNSGAYAVLDPHNYGRFDGSIITSTSDFQTWWKNVATEFASNDKVIFDTNNEYHDMEQSLVLDLNQAAINGIRAAGATTQYIFVEGNAYTGAWDWTTYNDDLSTLTDTEDKIIYEMHQYLDSDSSGTSETCVSSTIGQERLEKATAWLKSNNKQGIIGEFAGGVNSVCEEAVEGMLEYMSENSDVWVGASWWSAGPWWGTYMYSLEPTDGTAYSTYLPILEKYFPSGDASSSSSASVSVAAATSSATSAATSAVSTTAAAAITTTPAVQVHEATSSAQSSATSVSSSTSARKSKSVGPCKLSGATSSAASSAADATTSAVAATTPAAVPTTAVVSTSSVVVATTVAAPTTVAIAATTPAVAPSKVSTFVSSASSAVASSSGVVGVSDPQGAEATNSAGLVKQYYQCGGINWTGPTVCASPYKCVVQNDWYYQCVAE
ncbi:putative extracellular endoglucanase/cellulase [Aspergillus ibericus CBS 121593]|uniref:cellulase n=1 Tax=Aspergillus ibericus CBS 121593 TaxID=1448316 RepID=A0A395H7J4_9EURO|nr:cellulase-domain-containing protein [Aspergillus ibericus CBS 121593]RAL03529.1 cellulase-domain-containing protein [Aspergillus ibericus CBS 121593]